MAELKFDISKVMEGAIKEFKRQGLTVSKWISVDEALPNSGETVLIYYNNQFYIAKYNSDFAETMPWSGSGHWWGKELISFWLPIPEPPETTKG